MRPYAANPTSIVSVEDDAEVAESIRATLAARGWMADAELMACLRALIRRGTPDSAAMTLRIADLKIDLLDRTAVRGGVDIELQAREFRLLAVLAQHRGVPLTRTQLLERVWGLHFDPKTSVVETHISRLRAKIDRPFSVRLIHTVRGAGYCLHAPIGDST
ncbi:MAG: response regulator transcription factor [Gammaproteobacteria bacterium]